MTVTTTTADDEQTPTDPRRLRAWRNAIIAAFGLGGVTIASWGPRLPAVRAELGVSTGTLGVILGCGTLGAIAGLGASAPVVRRLGGRHAILASLAVAAGAMALMGAGVALHSVVIVAVALIVVGGGLSTLDVAINVEGSAVERVAGRTLLPLMHSGWSAGAAVGSGIGAACAAAGVGPAAEFAGIAVLLIATGLILTRSIPPALPATASIPEPTSPAKALRNWLRGWTQRRLLLIGLVLLGVEFGEGSANNWLTLAAKQGHGQSGAVAALFLTLFAVTEALTRVCGGFVVDRIGRVSTIRVTAALGIAGLVMFILGDAVWLVAGGVILWGVGVSMGFPLGMSAAAEGGDDPAAQVSAAASLAYVSGLVGPPLIGFLAESLGLLGALWLVAVLFTAAFAAAGALAPVSTLRPTAPPEI